MTTASSETKKARREEALRVMRRAFAPWGWAQAFKRWRYERSRVAHAIKTGRPIRRQGRGRG